LNRCVIEIYTDGSCHTQYNIGAWAAILLVAGDKVVLKDVVQNTTHNRMELMAVIKAVEFACENYQDASLTVYTDSQYVFRIPERMEKLKRSDFITKKGTLLHNHDLLQILIRQIEINTIDFVKVKAHQPADKTDLNRPVNFNSEVDNLVRQMVRTTIKKQEIVF
jgi:ribonuclease HI